jgi:TctA family transporter
MDMLANMSVGFSRALSADALLFCFIGVTVGTLVGVLPGIGTLAAISLCLPLTYYLDPVIALIMLAGIFYGTQYGGSITAILLNLPGEPSSAVTCLDAHPMTRQGRAGVALFITALASFVGGSLGIILMMSFTPTLSKIALTFSSVDYFAIILFCLVAASTLSTHSASKGLSMVVLGLMLGLCGVDVTSGLPRYTFGVPALGDGLDLVAIMMGLFGVAEVMTALSEDGGKPMVDRKSITLRSLMPSFDDIRQATWPTIRGSAIGAITGIMPGMGATLATFIAYATERRIAKDPTRFGKGAIEGIASPEAANNASVQTSFIPTIGLGIPSGAVMAVMVGAMMIHGIVPGPLFVSQHADIFWGLLASMWIGNVMLLILNIPLIGIWVRILYIPGHILYPVVLLVICIGVYSVNNAVFDVYVTILFGVIGFIFGKYGYPVAPLVLGFILSPILEEHVRRALLISDGDFSVFLTRPVSAVFIALSILVLLVPLISKAVALARAGSLSRQASE